MFSFEKKMFSFLQNKNRIQSQGAENSEAFSVIATACLDDSASTYIVFNRHDSDVLIVTT